jgi:hypothetical protein
MPRCPHTDSFVMPRGNSSTTTTISRCRTCNRDFDYDTGFLLAWRDGRYVYASKGTPIS